MTSNSNNLEFRIIPNGDGRWYWEVLRDGRDVMLRGLADNEPDACKDAAAQARKANLLASNAD